MLKRVLKDTKDGDVDVRWACDISLVMVAALLMVVALPGVGHGEAGPGQPSTKDGWIRLFDGQTLAGWKASEDLAAFSVRDGMIVAQARGSIIPAQAPHPKCHCFKNLWAKPL